ncbi:metallophosphoesterase [Chitinophaga sedimenti]|uniref:FN3 domain-containing metallophosphoesterase family protein n=1 Tax=Chitinophaga sedimenti TaxID=2033606 RepID=UPI002005BD4C|nr:FN3 domain-containing metallophosphoesterase family protein [Chitinophaga sedimenti]MCK7557642.1 metallophosphoesterase [Chitinophaga sedimenti]
MAGAETPIAPADHVFTTKPYLQCPTPTSMTIMWMTAKPCYSCWVMYGQNGQLDQKAHHLTDGMVEAYEQLNKISLEGLKPGTTYSYKVMSKEITAFQPYKLTYGETIESDTYTFTTPALNPKEVSWLVLNDIHDRPQSFGPLIGMNKDEHFDYLFLNGDMFDYQTDEQQIIDHLLTPLGEACTTVKPFIFVRGNHETRGKYRMHLHEYFDNPEHRNYFQYTWGPVHFTVLDTGEDKPDDTPVYAGIVDFDSYRSQQAEWLKRVVASPAFKKAKFRVVMMHIPHYHSGDWHGTLDCRAKFGPIFEQAKIDLLISGHTHQYGVYAPQTDHSYHIVIGGGPKEGNRTLIKVKATQTELNLRMLKDDGSEAGKVQIKTKR